MKAAIHILKKLTVHEKGDSYNYRNYNRDNYTELQQKIAGYSKDKTSVDL